MEQDVVLTAAHLSVTDEIDRGVAFMPRPWQESRGRIAC